MQQEETPSEENKKTTDNFLLVIYGCPGSGKTTFARKMQKTLKNCLLASTDSLEKKILTCPSIINCAHQMSAKQSIELIRALGQQLNFEGAKPHFESENWRASRKLMEQLIAKTSGLQSIILEDDLLLRSQRRVFRRICWKAQVKYLEIYMDSTLEECIGNVRKRNIETGDCVITEDIVMKSMSKIEAEDDYLTWKLKTSERGQVKAEDVCGRLRKVEIIPNDGCADKNAEVYQHSEAELMEIEVRNYIHLLMKMSNQNRQTELGPEVVALNDLHDKKVCAKVLAQWKKHLASSSRHIVKISIKQNLIQYLHKGN